MNKLVLATALLLQISITNAAEKYNHYPAIASADIQTAFCNIKNYNEELFALTNKPTMSTEDMVKIHELTYTLENAVNLLKDKLERVSTDLEDVHQASERLDEKTIKVSGEKYMAVTSKLLRKSSC